MSMRASRAPLTGWTSASPERRAPRPCRRMSLLAPPCSEADHRSHMNRLTAAAGSTALPLNNETVKRNPWVVDAPAYDRESLTPGIVHIGVGGFHRAHQEVYLDELAGRGVTDWGVVGLGLHSRSMKEALEPQDLLYTVVERDVHGDSARVVGTLDAYLYAPDDPEAVFGALADERIRLVTLTVTGAGYHVDPATLEFEADSAHVRHDVEHPECPTTFLAYVVEGLDRRRRVGEAPFTVLSCDNVPCNGAPARAGVVAFARLRDAGLAAWIEENVAFPSSMVDRITPETTDETTEFVQAHEE